MIYLIYVVLAALIIFCSNKASKYVDLIEKKSALSGAFLGGVVLSAVTSLPELFTSITSTVILDKPSLCMGNILGSNLFNLMILATLILFSFRAFIKTQLSRSHIKVTSIVLLIYGAIVLNMLDLLNFEIFTINITSIIIVILYIVGIRFMANENGEATIEATIDNDDKESQLSLRSIVTRFIIVSLGIISLSIAITYVTDMIAVKTNLGLGLAGAIFLGVATSLPEVASTISLFRLRSYNIGFSNIIGSNLFNLFILAVADLVYFGNGVYDFSDPKTALLLTMGTIGTTATAIFLIKRSKLTIWCPILVIASYLIFLLF